MYEKYFCHPPLHLDIVALLRSPCFAAFTAGTGTVIFNGATGTQTIANSSGETFNDLTVNKAGGDVQLSNNITVNGTITLTGGDVDLNGKTVSLGTTGTLSETAGNTVTGTSGTITAGNTALNAPSSYNMGGLGAKITSGANLGSTTITRGNFAQTGATNSSIKRFYDITPTTNTGLNATLVFYYDDSELNGLTESTLKLYRSTDGGLTWTERGGTVDVTNNNVTINNSIDAFSRWTLGSTSSPLPVELTEFAAKTNKDKVTLSWTTATEVNNYGFEVQRSAVSGQPSADIGFVQGAGNSNTTHNYSYKDKPIGGINFSYRLKQIDVDGKFKIYDAITVKLETPTKAELMQNSPNPFNPSTAIKFYVPDISSVTIKIYDILGKEVTTLINSQTAAGYHIVYWNGRDSYGNSASSGIYIYRLIAEPTNKLGQVFMETKKMALLK